jgi:hypothetical protein
VDIGAAALGFLMVATPVGWVGLIVAGVTVAGLSAGVSIVADNVSKTIAENNYDRIIRLVNRL